MSEDQKNIADKSFESSTHTVLFKLIFLLVRDHSLQLVVQVLLVLIMLPQASYFKFHQIIVKVWKDPHADTIASVFGYFNFTHYLIGEEYSLYQIAYYLLIGLLGFQIFLILISTLFIINQKEPVQLIIKILRYIQYAQITILYLPTLYVFTYALHCSDGSLTYFPSKTCWQGLIVIDQIISILAIILYIPLQLIVALLFFEGTYEPSKPLSKRNGRCYALFLLHQSFIILLTLMPSKDQNTQILFEIYGLGGSLFCYLFAKRNDAYNNRFMQKIILTWFSVDLWTSLMLCVSHLVEGRIMVGSLYTWMFCLPFILMLQFLQQHKREQCLMIYVNKFDNATQLVNHAHEVLKLVDMDRRRLPQGQLLNGYIEFHNQTCPNPLCPLKKVKFSLNMFKAKNEMVSKTDKRHQLVYDTMGRLFLLGMGKFTHDVFIRIEYSQFVLRVLKSKPQAIEELTTAEKMKCPFDLKYVIYYIKSVIEAEISELSGDGQDFTEQRDFDEKFTSFKNAMEKSVALLMEFWSQFADEKPDLLKLYEIGSKLFPIRLYVDTTWKRLQRVQNQQLPQALRLYSKYLIEIFNDRVGGFDLLEQARKIETQFSQRKAFKLGISSNLNVDGQEDGCVFLSLEEDRFGQIYAVNKAAASMCGYEKSEILNKKVNNIMPSLFSRYHDDFLKRFLDTNEATLLNKERQLLAKSKNLYIHPITVLLRPVYHVLKEGVEFVATFKKEKRIKDVAHLVCNKDMLIEDISTSCITLLGIDLKCLQIQEIHLQDLFPDLQENLAEYKFKGGRVVEYTHPRLLDDHIAFGQSDFVLKLNVQIIELNFLIMKSSENLGGLAGYQIKIERIADQNQSLLNQNKVAKTTKQSNFQFRFLFLQQQIGFYGDFADTTYSEMITHIQDNSMFQSQENEAGAKQQDSKLSQSQIKLKQDLLDYGAGIKTMRLFEGQIVDIERFQSDLDMESYEEVQQKKVDDHIQESDEPELESGYFKSSKELQETLNQQSESRPIRWLQYTSILLAILLVVISILNNVFERYEISSQAKSWSLIIRQSDLIMGINEITSLTREMMLINEGFSKYEYSDLLKDLEQKVKHFDQLSKEVYQEDIEQHMVMMFSNLETFQSRVLEQASQELISTALNIQKLKQKDLHDNQSEQPYLHAKQGDYFFLTFNVLNDFMKWLLISYHQQVSKSKDMTESLRDDTLIILVVSACLTLLASIVLALILTSTLDKRQEILSIFLDIPERTAKLFYSKCENFLQQIGSNEDDEVMSELDIIEEKSVEENISLLGRKKKRFKNNENKHLGFFLRMFLVAIVIESYYIMVYFLNSENITQKSNILNEFNQTALSASYYAFIVNSLKQFIYNNSLSILNSEANITIAELINNTYHIDTNYQRLHAVNVDYNSEEYITFYNELMFENLCTKVANSTCETFADKILQHGLMTAVARHFQNIRKLHSNYLALYNNASYPFPEENYTMLQLSENQTLSRLRNLLNIPESYEINEMQFVYLRSAFAILKEKYLEIVNRDQENFAVQQLILMIFYILAIVISMFFCWNPFLRRLNREIWSTKCLLTFIPIDEISKIRTINNYIRTVILEQNI